MVKELQGKWVVPNPQVPRSFGIMNIVFGSLLLLVGAGYGCWYLYSPTFSEHASPDEVCTRQDQG